MTVTVQRLTAGWERPIEAMLMAAVDVNLFLLGFVRSQPMDRAYWCGAVEGDAVRGLALVVPERLVVPFCPDPDDATAIGAHLRERFEPTLLVGPRVAGDALWRAWAADRVKPERWYDQRLYVATRSEGPPVEGFRPARMSEWREVARASGRMEYEDLGRDPYLLTPTLHERVVRERLRNGRTFVIERGGALLFQINVGTAIPEGAQVGGTWVPPALRGQGLATEGMRAICAHLLGQHPRVTLHVNEANKPAVRVYERVGFVRDAPFRLATV